MFKLPRLQKNLRLVDRDGTPALTFMRWFNADFAGAIETQEAAQAVTDQELIEINDVQDMLIEDLTDVQETQGDEIDRLNAALAQISALLGLTQQAQLSANNAQDTADEALADGTVAGSATDPAIDISLGGWVLGPQVDLLGVVAGTLTIMGSGPQQDGDTVVSGSDGVMACEFRVVEVVAAVDTVLFTGNFSADLFSGATYITNTSGSAVAAYSAARSTTGAVSYRIDARKLGSNSISSLLLYVYARRTP